MILLVISACMVVLLLPSIRRLSFNIWLGAIATGLAFSLVALGVYLTFWVLDFPDLTIAQNLTLALLRDRRRKHLKEMLAPQGLGLENRLSIGYLYNAAEANSVFNTEIAEPAAADLGLTLETDSLSGPLEGDSAFERLRLREAVSVRPSQYRRIR